MRRDGGWLRIAAEVVLLFGGIRIFVTSGGMLVVAAALISRGDWAARSLLGTSVMGLVTSGCILLASFHVHAREASARGWAALAAGAGLVDLLLDRAFLVGAVAATVGGLLALVWHQARAMARANDP